MGSNTKVFNSPGESNRLHKIKYIFGLLLCLAGINLTVTAAAWNLDTTFGSGGKVVTDVPVGAADMALQSDGKIVMVGGYTASIGAFTVARYNADGSLDITFGSGGIVSIPFGGSREVALAVAVQPDGKIVVGGQATTGNVGNVAIARLNSNGSLDTTFDGDGKLTRSFSLFSIPYHTSISAVRIANDGKIVFAGTGARMAVIGYVTVMGRLNADGSFDNTFGTDGVLFDGSTGSWKDLAIQADGTIIAVGDDQTQFRGMMKASKFNSSGGPVWSYARGQDFQFMSLNSLAVQADGKTVAVGRSFAKIFAIRFNADGSLDTTFTEAADLPVGESRSAAVQADGKIIANVVFPSAVDGFSLIRYNTNGTVDTSFGNNGIVTTRISANGLEAGNKVLIQPDGKILVGGSFNSIISDKRGNSFVMARYLGGSATPSARRAKFDYDGDGKSDISVFRPSENRWYILRSSDSGVTQQTFGASGDAPVPADYDGDGKTDIAIFRPSSGDWWYLSSASGAYLAAHWGQNGDIPRPADYDLDGKTDFIVYRPSNSTWYFLGSRGNSSVIQFGTAEDKPLIEDFDGDGKVDYAVYRPSTGVWWYAASGSLYAHRAVQFGISTDIPVPADYDGDGKTDFAVYRPSNGGWHILNSSNGSYVAFPFGDANDKPVAADYDGDGKADVGVFRPSNGSWYLLRSTSGFSGVQWGTSTDIPTQNAFIQ